MFEDPILKARQNEFLQSLSADDARVFDAARRIGATFGEAQIALLSDRRRRAKETARAAACKPTARPTAAPSAPKPTARPAPTAGLTIPRPAPQQLTPFERWSRDHGKPTKGVFELTAQDVASMQADSCRCLAGKPIDFEGFVR